MKATIMGHWEIDLPYIPRDENREPWFLDWVLKSPKQSGDHMRCGYLALAAVRDVYDKYDIIRVQEYFGGIGAQARMVQTMFDPETHIVTDISPEAVRHLCDALPREVAVYMADAYDPYSGSRVGRGELSVLDFGDLTVLKAQPGRPQGDLLERVFQQHPHAVVLTDIAARYLHLQKRSYEPILGEGSCDSYEAYLLAFGRHIEARYGYVLHQANYTRWSAVMTFLPRYLRHPKSGELRKLGPALPNPVMPEDFPGLVLS